jgi:hypothetical protein
MFISINSSTGGSTGGNTIYVYHLSGILTVLRETMDITLQILYITGILEQVIYITRNWGSGQVLYIHSEDQDTLYHSEPGM